MGIQGSIFKLSRESERWYPVWLDASKWSLVVFNTKLRESAYMPQIKLCHMVLLGSDQGWTGMDSVAAAFTTVHYQACESPRPTSKLQQWACGICRVNHHVFNIQRYWRGYSIRKCNAVRVLSPYRRVARSSPAQRNETNIFEGRGGTSRMRIDLSTPDGPRVESQATTTLTPPQLAHLSSRVALVLLRQGPSGLQVAVEECEGELVLPSTAVSPTDTLCYRGQLSRMLCNMNIPSAVLDALPYASSFRARNSILPRCQFFVQDFRLLGVIRRRATWSRKFSNW